MKPLLLLTAMTILALAILLLGEQLVKDADNPQFIPHPNGALLAVYFAHADHTEQNCVTCHHNYTDNTGMGMCFDCHKTDQDIAHLIEEQFHTLCRGCHLEQQLSEERLSWGRLSWGGHGPTRACIDCHVKENFP